MALDETTNFPAVDQRKQSRFLGQKIIKHGFQFKFSLIVFAFLSAAVFVIWLEGRIAVDVMVKSGLVNDSEAVLQLKRLNSVVGNTSVLALAIVFGLSLFFSHFVAGPIYRFEKTLEEMKKGNLSINVQLRKHDELQEVADVFNQALASLRLRLKKERDVVSGGLGEAQAFCDALRPTDSKRAAELEEILKKVSNAPPQITI